MDVDQIILGERHRKDLGSIEALAKSIDEIGLLHPVVVRPDGVLIAGQRRLAACKMLGWAEIPATVIDLGSVIRGEHDENVLRKDFTPSEAVAIGQALEPMERAAAKERMLIGRPSEKFTEGPAPRALDRVASAVGMSRPTYEKAKAVVDSGDDELIERMDDTGNVSRAYRTMREAEMRQELRDHPIELPQGKYHAIVIDPPWDVTKILRDERPNQDAFDYPTMTDAEISALPIRDLAAAPGCHVYLWVTHKKLPIGLDLFERWGVRYQCMMTWVKPTGMTPFSWMYNTEHVLFGRVGSLKLKRMGLKLSFEAPVTRHSEKPDIFYGRVIQASPGPRLEMFARQPRDGFVVWGNEVS